MAQVVKAVLVSDESRVPEALRSQLIAALAALLVADLERRPVPQHDKPEARPR